MTLNGNKNTPTKKKSKSKTQKRDSQSIDVWECVCESERRKAFFREGCPQNRAQRCPRTNCGCPLPQREYRRLWREMICVFELKRLIVFVMVLNVFDVWKGSGFCKR